MHDVTRMSTKEVVGIFLASSGSRGDHLLFRYPYETIEDQHHQDECLKVSGSTWSKKNPYAVQIIEDPYHSEKSGKGSFIVNDSLVGFSDTVLANLMAVKAKLCGSKFEVRIDDVVFIGSPMLLHPMTQGQPSRRESPTIISFNVVFAVQASVKSDRLLCYHDLTKQLAVALKHEERRFGLLSKQKNIMWAIQDDVAAMPEDSAESPYKLILEKCHLAQQLKLVYDELYNSGVVQIYINKWIHINWCLPQKLNHMQHSTLKQVLKPYHGMLLLIDENSLLELLPIDCSPSLIRLVRVSSPFKNLQSLASDADLSLSQVYQLVIHLVYWSKATIIYPLCEANIYVLSSNVNTSLNSLLVEKFNENFPGVSLPAILSDFSVPTALGDQKDVLDLPQQQAQDVQIVTWLLQHSLLVQLHTFVFLVSPQPTQPTQPTSKTSTLSANVEGFSRTRKISSNSANSVNSDESQSVSNFSAKSPSLEGISDFTDEWIEKGQWPLSGEQLVALLKSLENQRNSKSPTGHSAEDLKLLTRLSPYFDGKHHLEEIMYTENIRRSQLLMVLDKFRDILITSQHEDPGITERITDVCANIPLC